MKVKMSKYPSRLICNIYDDYMTKKYGVSYKNNTLFESLCEYVDDFIQQYIYNPINIIYFDKKEQKIDVRIDDYDCWDMSHSMGHIILPMLKILKQNKHGAPIVNMDDVPENLRGTEEELKLYNTKGMVSDKHFERWDWIMDEMIWAFTQILDEAQYLEMDLEKYKEHNERISNGTRLFGVYYRNLWD